MRLGPMGYMFIIRGCISFISCPKQFLGYVHHPACSSFIFVQNSFWGGLKKRHARASCKPPEGRGTPQKKKNVAAQTRARATMERCTHHVFFLRSSPRFGSLKTLSPKSLILRGEENKLPGWAPDETSQTAFEVYTAIIAKKNCSCLG